MALHRLVSGGCAIALACLLVGCASSRGDVAEGVSLSAPVQEHASAEAMPGTAEAHVTGAQEPAVQSSSQEASSAQTAYADSEFEDYGDESPAEQIADPLEPWNRFWFGFNDVLLLKVIKPVYTGYTIVTPVEFRSGLSNFLHNIQMPIRFANSLLQGRVGQAGVELGRFLVNSTVGFGGLIDVAKRNKPLVAMSDRDPDFGQTLAVWGVGEGFYLVWPLLGPSTVRDTVGTAGDYAASPFFWAVEPVGKVASTPAMATNIGLRFNDMGRVIDAYESVTKGAIEPYVAARDAYIKYRRAGAVRGTNW